MPRPVAVGLAFFVGVAVAGIILAVILKSGPEPVTPPAPSPAPTPIVAPPQEALAPFEEPEEELVREVAAALEDLRLGVEGCAPAQATACFADGFTGDTPFDPWGEPEEGRLVVERAAASEPARPVADRLREFLGRVDAVTHFSVAVVDARPGSGGCDASLEVRLQARVGRGRIHAIERYEATFGMAPRRIARMRRASGHVAVSRRPAFRDATRDAGLELPPMIECHGCAYRTPMVQFGGVSTGDVDGDDRPDVFLPGPGESLLFKNLGDGRFEKLPEEAGVGRPAVGSLFVDLNGDGRLDIFTTGICAEPAACPGCALGLFLNRGDGRFEDVTDVSRLRRSGHAFSATAADFDGDGDLDVYVGFYGPVKHTPEGFLTYELNNESFVDARNAEPNQLLRNNGDGTFTDVAGPMGVADTGWTLACTFSDFDGDARPDLYVVNDFGANVLYVNRGERFEDATARFGAEARGFGMGVARGDYDLDGRLDTYVTGIHAWEGQRLAGRGVEPVPADVRERVFTVSSGNSLLRASQEGPFDDVGRLLGVNQGGWAWGSVFIDYNSDSRPDLYVANGWMSARLQADLASTFWRLVRRRSLHDKDETTYRRLQTEMARYARTLYESSLGGIARVGNREFDRHLLTAHGHEDRPHLKQLSFSGDQENRLYLNYGGQFAEVGGAEGAASALDSRGVAVADFDRDGRPDLFVRNAFAPSLTLLRNECESPWNAVTIRLWQDTPNRFAIGAKVTVLACTVTRVREMTCGDSYLSSSAPELHFGMRHAERCVKVEVRWPDGTVEEWQDLPVNGFVTLTRGARQPEFAPYSSRAPVELAARPGPLREGEMFRGRLANALEGEVDVPAAGSPVTIVHLWSLYVPFACVPEVRKYAEFARAAEAAGGAALFSVCIEGDREQAAEVARGLELPVPVLLGTDEAWRLVNADVPLFPTTVALAGDGRILLRRVGAMTADEFGRFVAEARALAGR